eukprot:m.236701 g.236701  ORF g.236701 m.236701 type:complete len:50 (+) comp19352_c0_seq1:378-527(+)
MLSHCHLQYDPDYSYSSIVSRPCSSYALVFTVPSLGPITQASPAAALDT